MTTAKANIRITEGPSRESLFDALKYACDKNHPHTVKFRGFYGLDDDLVRVGQMDVIMKIVAIEHEDGSGMSFNLKGYAINLAVNNRPISFYYNANRRMGFIPYPER